MIPAAGSTRPRAARARPAISLGWACDGACVFCAQDGRDGPPRPLAEVEAELARLAAEGASELTFVGGEPLLAPSLDGAVAAARRLGFTKIGVQTSGRRLTPERARALAAAGVTDVQLSLHGARPEVHDYHAGVDGALAASVAGLGAARAAGLEVAVATVVTRSNQRNLAELARLLAARGAAAWLLAIPHAAGAAAASFDRVIPRLGLAVPFALHALEVATRLGLPAFVAGAPLCALGPFASRALPLDAAASAPRAYGEACDGCAARAACPGVDPTYLARFGGDELAPREAPPGAALPGAAALFAGPGPLDLPAVAEVPPPPAAARVGLPVLGKVKPARREVSAAAPKKSGEALAELFPELFTGERK